MPASDAGLPTQPSATAWLRRLYAGEMSARELTSHFIERIELVNDRLNAVVVLDHEGALAAADAADFALRQGDRRPLLGLPITIKDSLEVVGMVSSGGSIARRNHVPDTDATAVERVRRAGAVILGKTNVPEYSSSYETDNVVYGRTSNPYDVDRTPGGSSGGEAALAAAEATPLGLGTDGLGSIRVPAHYCGVLGLRPTIGRVPDTGNWPSTRASGYMDFYCVGPIGRSVEDLVLALRVISGADGIDPYAVDAPLLNASDVDIRDLRFGFFTSGPRLKSSSGTVAAVERSAALLESAGASLREVQVPWEPNPTEVGLAAITADGGELMVEDLAAAGGEHHPGFADFIRLAKANGLSAAGWFRLQHRIFEFRRKVRGLFQEIDVLIGPVAAGPAPKHGHVPTGAAAEEHDDYRAFDPAHFVAVAGLPAISVPAGWEGSLPIGTQVAAAPYREDIVLAVADLLRGSWIGKDVEEMPEPIRGNASQ